MRVLTDFAMQSAISERTQTDALLGRRGDALSTIDAAGRAAHVGATLLCKSRTIMAISSRTGGFKAVCVVEQDCVAVNAKQFAQRDHRDHCASRFVCDAAN